MKLTGIVLSWMAGSKMGKLYISIRDLLSGYKTHIVGIATICNGIVQLIGAMEGTNLSNVLELFRHPAVDQISLGLGMMTLRSGIHKLENKATGGQ